MRNKKKSSSQKQTSERERAQITTEKEASDLLAELRRAEKEMFEATDNELWSLARPLETVKQYRERKLAMYNKLIGTLESLLM